MPCVNNSASELVIFDVGANVGQYTKLLKDIFSKDIKEIHCFKPSKYTYNKLNKNLDDYNAILNNMGLSNEPSTQTLFFDEKASGLASLYKRELTHFNIDMSQTEEVKLTTLDLYCTKNNITKIDLLKLDVEGHEINALKGGTEMINSDKVSVIQFEFGGCNIDSRTYFQDFWYLLSDRYKIYRILSDGLLEIKNYSESLEVFSYQNFLAVHKEYL